jgi:hypothetical protein
VSERWRDHYDTWRLAAPPEGPVDEDGEPIDVDRLEAEAEAAAEARAERMREDMMFDRESWDD